MAERNLILIHRGGEQEQDFDEIASKVRSLDGSISCYLMSLAFDGDLPAGAWAHPSLTVILAANYRFKVRRGPVLVNRAVSKLAQQEVFRRHGLRAPPALAFRFGMKLDPILFGDFVILKPSNLRLTSRREGVTLVRRRRLETMTAADFPKEHPIRLMPDDYIVQRFVDTGRRPSSYRATTFLGEVICLERILRTDEAPPLDAADAVIEQGNFTQKGPRIYELAADQDALDFARATAAAFPGVPLLGVDLIRDLSGRLHVLEVNAGGNTWHFSSPMFAEARLAMPEFFRGLREQFGAFDRAAEALVRRVHASAA